MKILIFMALASSPGEAMKSLNKKANLRCRPHMAERISDFELSLLKPGSHKHSHRALASAFYSCLSPVE